MAYEILAAEGASFRSDRAVLQRLAAIRDQLDYEIDGIARRSH